MINNLIIHKPKTKKVKEKNLINFKHDKGIITPTEISELQGSLQELNNDDINLEHRTSGIDLRTRLFNCEIASIVVLDTLVSFKFLPLSISPFTLQKKRLAVSLKGKGREEIVDIVQGKREQDVERSSLGNKLKGMFTKGE
jgi:pyruvate/oxaloacetate carboxyltransferase